MDISELDDALFYAAFVIFVTWLGRRYPCDALAIWRAFIRRLNALR